MPLAAEPTPERKVMQQGDAIAAPSGAQTIQPSAADPCARVQPLIAQFREAGSHDAEIMREVGREQARAMFATRSVIHIPSPVADEALKRDRDLYLQVGFDYVEEALIASGLAQPQPAIVLGKKGSGLDNPARFEWLKVRVQIEREVAEGFYEEVSALCRGQLAPLLDEFQRIAEGLPSPLRGAITKARELHQSKPRLMNLDECLKAMEARETLVEGMLAEQSVVIVVGDSNSGKTTVLQKLAMCVATGREFNVRQVTEGRVLWVAGEDERNAQLRGHAYADALHFDRAKLAENFLILPERIAVLNDDTMAGLHQAIAERWGPDAQIGLVVLDTKSMNWGGDEENSNDENAEFVAAVKRHFVARYGAAVIVTHHLTKDKDNKTARGAGSLINNADEEWRFFLRESEDGPGCRFEQGSKRRSAQWAPVFAKIETHTLEGERYAHLANEMGLRDSVSIARLVNAHGVPVPRVSRREPTMKLLRLMVANPTDSQSALALKMGYSRDGGQRGAAGAIRHLFEKLATEGLVRKDPRAPTGFKVARKGIERAAEIETEEQIMGEAEPSEEGQE